MSDDQKDLKLYDKIFGRMRETAESDYERALVLIAELKVTLLADHDAAGGLRADTRQRAWSMVADLGKLLLKNRTIN